MRRRPIWKGDRGQFGQRPHVHRSLEIDDLTHRLPEIHPAILIEFRLGRAPEVELRFFAFQPQQEPSLFLPDAHRVPVSPHILGWQTIPQPARGLANQFDVRWRQSNLLVQLSVSSLLQPLTGQYPTLGELPAPTSDLPSEKSVPCAAHQDDADVSAKAV